MESSDNSSPPPTIIRKKTSSKGLTGEVGAEVGGNTHAVKNEKPLDLVEANTPTVVAGMESSDNSSPPPTIIRKKASSKGSLAGVKQKSRSATSKNNIQKCGEVLRNIERAAANTTVEQQWRELESRQIEKRNELAAKEQLKSSSPYIINKQRRESDESFMRDVTVDPLIGSSSGTNTIWDSLLSALILNNQESVKTSLWNIVTVLKDASGGREVIEKADTVIPACDSLLNSLRLFPSNREIVTCSISCVSLMLEGSNNSVAWIEEAGRCGLCEYLIDACRMDEDVCDHSLRVCTTLTNDSTENRKRIGTSHNCDVISDLYLQYKLNAVMVLRLTRLVQNIATSSPYVLDNLGLSGVCERILDCLDAHCSNQEMVSDLSLTILLCCYNHHSINRQRFASCGAEVFIKCLQVALVPGAGDIYKQMCIVMTGVFATTPDKLHLLSPDLLADIAKTVVLGHKVLDDTHLKATLALIFNFGSNDAIRAALVSADLKDALINMISNSQRSGISRLAELAYGRITSHDTEGPSQPASARRSGGVASTQGKMLATAPTGAPAMASLPVVGTEALGGTSTPVDSSPTAGNTSMPSISTGVPSSSSPSLQERVPMTDKKSQKPMSPSPARVDGMNDTIVRHSPHKPHKPLESNSSGNAPPNRVPRKVVERTYTAISESDPLFKELPVEQSDVPDEDVAGIRLAEEVLQRQVSHENAVRHIQRVFRGYVSRRRHDAQSNSVKLRLATLLSIVDKSSDEGILVTCIETAIECHHNDLGLKALQRCNAIVKHAKETKENSKVAVNLINKPNVLIDLTSALMDDSDIVLASVELITRISYVGGANDAFGKAGVFEVLYTALNKYPDNAVLVGAIVVCGVRLTSKKTSNKKRAGTKEGFRAIVNIYKYYLDNPIIVDRLTRYTCNCIDNLPACQDYFREAGGCEVIVNVYTLGPEHLDSMEIVSRLVINLTALNNEANMKALGTRQIIWKYFDGLAIASMHPKVFKSVAMMICNVFGNLDLFVDTLFNCDLPLLLIGIFEKGNLSTDLDRQEVVFAAVMIVQFFTSLDTLHPMLVSSRLPNIISQYTDKAYVKRIRKAASMINKRLQVETSNSVMSESSGKT